MNNEIGEFGKMLKRNEEREIQNHSLDVIIPSRDEPHPLSSKIKSASFENMPHVKALRCLRYSKNLKAHIR